MDNQYISEICNRIVGKLGYTPGTPDFDRMLSEYLPFMCIVDPVRSGQTECGTQVYHNVHDDRDELEPGRPTSAYLRSTFNDVIEPGAVDIDGLAFVQDDSQTLNGLREPVTLVALTSGPRDDLMTYEPADTYVVDELGDEIHLNQLISRFEGFGDIWMHHDFEPQLDLVITEERNHRSYRSYEKWMEAKVGGKTALDGRAVRRDVILSSVAASMHSNLSDIEHLQRAVGVYPDQYDQRVLHPLPTQVMTNTGFRPRRGVVGSQPILGRHLIATVPVEAGYNKRQKRFRWFGAAMKVVGRDRRDQDVFRINLSDVYDLLLRDVAELVGDENVRPFSLRPLAQTRIALRYQNGNTTTVWADVWPLTDRIGIAVAVPASSDGRDVRRFSNWSSRQGTGLACTSRIKVTPQHLGVLLGGGMGSQFLQACCPDPVLNLSTKRLDALRDRVLKVLLGEETCLLVLEGVHS